MGGTYGTPSAPTLTKAFLLKAETRVLLGTGGSSDLETTSGPAVTYSAPIGFGSGKGLDLGLLADLGFSHAPTIEPIGGVNLQEESIWEVTGEECEVTLTLLEWRPEVIAHAIATGKLRILSDGMSTSEALITFGGGCALDEYPLVIEFTNISCHAPSTQNIGAGITAGILTLYKTIQTGGLSWDAITAKERNALSMTFKVLQDVDRARRNRLGNLYLY